MKFEIEKPILELAVKCNKHQSCVADDSIDLCEVEYCLESTHFVRCIDPSCEYSVPFGDGYLCSCPVRKEIFRRYRV